jgi:hypothetical protein
MPREAAFSAASKEATPSGEPSLEQRKKELFDEIVLKIQKSDIKSNFVEVFLKEIFENSLEDGIALVDRLRSSPDEIYLSAFSELEIKHPKVCRIVEDKVHQMAESDTDLFGEESERMQEIVSIAQQEDRAKHHHLNIFKTDYIKDLEKISWFPLYKQVENYYADVVLASSKPKIREKQEQSNPSIASTNAERMAQGYLAQNEEVLEQRFYTGPVKEMFPAIAHLPELYGPTVKKRDLFHILEKHNIDGYWALIQLNPATYVAYRETDSLKRAVVEQELVKELKKELPEDKEVKLDRVANEWKIEDKTKEEKDELKERTRHIDQRAVEEAKKVPLKNAMSFLVGVDTPEAWKLREYFIAQNPDAYPETILASITGCDSEKAWEIRDRLYDEKVFDSYQYELRQLLLKSLNGLDSERAWRMRFELNSDGDFFW